MSYKEMYPDYILPVEVEIFLNLQSQLNISSVDDAKQIIKNTRLERIEINKIKNKY